MRCRACRQSTSPQRCGGAAGLRPACLPRTPFLRVPAVCMFACAFLPHCSTLPIPLLLLPQARLVEIQQGAAAKPKRAPRKAAAAAAADTDADEGTDSEASAAAAPKKRGRKKKEVEVEAEEAAAAAEAVGQQ